MRSNNSYLLPWLTVRPQPASTIKYEEVYLHAYKTVSETRAGIAAI
jgi:hypothetical protein